MKFPECPNSLICPCDPNPLTNFSSEGPDKIGFRNLRWNPTPNPCLGQSCGPNPCTSNCAPDVCTADDPCPICVGNGCNNNNGSDSPSSGGSGSGSSGGIPPTYFCARGSCAIECPTGSGHFVPFTGSNVYCCATMAEAQARANSDACSEGRRKIVPLGNHFARFEAQCDPPESGPPNSATVAEGTFTRCLVAPTAAEIDAAQQELDAQAQALAEANARAGLHCGTCNNFMHSFAACPGDPTKVASLTYQRGELLCMPFGTPQSTVDALASQMMYNNLQARLADLGCACVSGWGSGVLSTTCPLTFTLLWLDDHTNMVCVGLFGVISVNGLLNVQTTYDGNCGAGSFAIAAAAHGGYLIVPTSFTAPIITVKFP